MTFLSAVIFLNFLHMFAALRSYGRKGRVAAHMALRHSMLSVVGSAGQVITLGDDSAGLASWCFGVFALGSVILLGFRVRDTVRTRESGRAGWRLGLLLCGQLSAFYIGFAVCDHALFVRGGGATVVDPASLGMARGPCALAVVPRRQPQRHTHYRCVNNVVFSPGADAPFVPWPAYQEVTEPPHVALPRSAARTRQVH